ncbi:MAG: hypothetical protein HDR05_12225 [Lachnospiraceae bacterium]|nr:hypothetical protein [Lachnospiraceae bacterium]
MEQYREQYREETAQVHAPIDLIERTKAAVRAEEERLLRERTAQSGMRQPEMAGPGVTYADYAKYGKTSSIRKWTYPLTAAAALLILVSVSLTMRGLKSENAPMALSPAFDGTAESGAAYEESAEFDAGFAEEAAEATVEMEEEEGADLERAAGATESAAAEAPAADMAPAINETQKAMSAADDTAGTEGSNAIKEETKQNQETDREEDLLADMAADKDSIIMEKVEKKPAFCDLPDTKTYVHEEETFIVRKEKAGWVAYVETGNGAGYMFRGDMEDVEEFLEAAYEKLLKEK